MSRKSSLLRLDRQLDALMLFVYCKMLLSPDLSDVRVGLSASLPGFHWKYWTSVVEHAQRGFLSKLMNRI